MIRIPAFTPAAHAIHLWSSTIPKRDDPKREGPKYDARLKKLFSHSWLVQELIRRRVPEWADQVDFSTLRKWPTELIGPRLEKRYLDLAWRCASKDRSTDHLLLIEFQAQPETDMALRVAEYASLAVNELLERRRQRGDPEHELRIKSLVLYHGDRPWNAPLRAGELLGGSSLDSYDAILPQLPSAAEPGLADLPALVLGLGGKWTPQDIEAEMPGILRALRQRRDDDFSRTLASEIMEMLVFRGVSRQHLEEGVSMEGVKMEEATMETVASVFQRGWNARIQRGVERGRKLGVEQGRKQGLEQGLEQGRKQGLERGLEQGQARILRQLATRKFGSAAEAELSKALGGRMSPEQAGRLADAVLESDSADEFLGRVREVAAR